MQQTVTFAVLLADLTKTRRGDSLQPSPRITYPKYVDTNSPWGWRAERGLQSARATRHSDRIAFPFLLSILSSSRLNKRPPRQREMILGDSWVSCFLIQSPHFAELSGERKKKENWTTTAGPAHHLGAAEFETTGCWVLSSTGVLLSCCSCCFRQLPTVSDERRDRFQEVVNRVLQSRATHTCQKKCVRTPVRNQLIKSKLACIFCCLMWSDYNHTSSTMIQNYTIKWYNKTKRY